MAFKPIKLRENGFNIEMIDYIKSIEYDERRPMGNIGIGGISDICLAMFLGMHNAILSTLPSRIEWIKNAIAVDEDFGVNRNLHRVNLHSAKVIAEWLIDGENDIESWDNSRVYEEAAWRFEARPWPVREIINSGLSDYMAFSYQGGEYDEGFEAGIETYERWTGKSGIPSFSKVMKPYEFGYTLCLHQIGKGGFDEADLHNAGRRMLAANLEENWLGRGQIITAAMWLKIVYSVSGQTLTPAQTLLKAYENMPNVQKPLFIQEIEGSAN